MPIEHSHTYTHTHTHTHICASLNMQALRGFLTPETPRPIPAQYARAFDFRTLSQPAQFGAGPLPPLRHGSTGSHSEALAPFVRAHQAVTAEYLAQHAAAKEGTPPAPKVRVPGWGWWGEGCQGQGSAHLAHTLHACQTVLLCARALLGGVGGWGGFARARAVHILHTCQMVLLCARA